MSVGIWIVSACDFNNSGSASGAATLNIWQREGGYWFGSIYLPAIVFCVLQSNVVFSPETSTAAHAAVNVYSQRPTVRHNTLIAAGSGGTRAIAGGYAPSAPPGLNVDSCLLLNYTDADLMATGPSSSDFNIIVGPIDDSSRGASGNYVVASPGLSNAIAAAVLDPVSAMPLAGSPALGAGTFSPYTSYPYVGYPLGTNHDVGAVENTTLPLPNGDVNNDGVLGLADVTELGNYLAGNVPLPAGDLDVDNSGVVDQLDIDYLAKYFVGNGPNPQP